jgi:hypothetical protein
MRPSAAPLASHEVRWFFEGSSADHAGMRKWFEAADPFRKGPGVGAPIWKGRLDDHPDVYLLIPGADDMGIKWREGELQVKGRVSNLGVHLFCGRHLGHVERWVKWSYSNLPDAYKRIVTGEPGSSALTAAVQKTRALRKVRLDTMTGAAEEVDAGTFVDRGLNAELTDLKIGGKSYCSLGFEAFPDDAAMHAAFSQAVATFLEGLAQDLGADRSQSYPQWLRANMG